jgi:hypothetical protein
VKWRLHHQNPLADSPLRSARQQGNLATFLLPSAGQQDYLTTFLRSAARQQDYLATFLHSAARQQDYLTTFLRSAARQQGNLASFLQFAANFHDNQVHYFFGNSSCRVSIYFQKTFGVTSESLIPSSTSVVETLKCSIFTIKLKQTLASEVKTIINNMTFPYYFVILKH